MDEKKALPPTILVIFGVSGDLAQRYLLPALLKINRNKKLPAEFHLVGISRQNLSVDKVLADQSSLRAGAEIFQMDLGTPDDYIKLKERLAAIGSGFKATPQIIFYFAVPPVAVLPIIRHLGNSGLNDKNFNILLEKPFGVDLSSADDLIKETAKHFKEEQVYRIDHYLAKEMAQNITVFLGGNVLFRHVWNNDFISRIDIIASEKIDIEGRVHFYEQSGALRDVLQSHLLQLAALVLMKPCTDLFDFREVPRHRLEALNQLQLDGPVDKSVIAGQYEGYTSEVENSDSNTETFVCTKLKSADPRWSGVPIRLITGKALDQKFTEIRVHFKKSKASEANRLTLRIQPREGIELELWVKKPGYDHNLQQLPLDFNYDQYFGQDLPDAYEQVIIDAMRGSQNLFAGSQEVLASWRILEPVQQYWSMHPRHLKIYAKGSNYKDVLA